MPADRDRIVRHIEGGGAWLAPDGRVHTEVATLPSEADFAGTDEAAIEQARQALLARRKVIDDELGKLEKRSAEAQQAREKAQARQAEQQAQAQRQAQPEQPGQGQQQPAQGAGQAAQAEEKGEAAPPFEAQAEGEGDEDARGRRGRRR